MRILLHLTNKTICINEMHTDINCTCKTDRTICTDSTDRDHSLLSVQIDLQSADFESPLHVKYVSIGLGHEQLLSHAK